MINVKVIVGVLATLSVSGAAFGIGVRVGKDQRTIDRQAQRFQDFCIGTWLAVQSDALSLKSTEPKRQDEAFARFYESNVMYHNSASIDMCLEEVPEISDWCFVNKDLTCLGDAAERISGALERNYRPTDQ